jgi:hypothetical protein
MMSSFIQVPRKETAVSIQTLGSFLIRQDLGKASGREPSLGKKVFAR